MILRFSLYSAAGVALLSSSATDAFVTSQGTFRTREFQQNSSLDRDWDNDDFLSSLSGGSEDMAEANAKYQALSESRAKTNQWRARQMQMHMESTTQDTSRTVNESGGYGPSPELLRKMMGESDEDIGQQPAPQMQQQQQAQAAVPPPPQQQQFYDANGNPVDVPLIYDANGNLLSFYPPPQQQQPMTMEQQPVQQMRSMNAAEQMQQQPPAQQIQPDNSAPSIDPAVPSLEPVAWEPSLPSNPKTRDSPRPVGYNADAYAVSNTADVYFAQLKQDSRVRKKAWLAGDRETANQVFTDPSVTAIKDQWVDNPYTREKNIQEARAEIEGAVRMQQGADDESTKYSNSGVSYKQKLEQIKAKRRDAGFS